MNNSLKPYKTGDIWSFPKNTIDSVDRDILSEKQKLTFYVIRFVVALIKNSKINFCYFDIRKFGSIVLYNPNFMKFPKFVNYYS